MFVSRTWLRLLTVVALGTVVSVTPSMAQIAQTIAETPTTRTIEHAAGQTEIPLDPQRIVTLHNVFAEALSALGLSPIGSVDRPSGMPAQLLASLADTTSVGSHSAPDFERVLKLEPDLILAQKRQLGDDYERLTAIAPTLLLDEPETEWRDWYRGLGRALGRADAAEAAIIAYDDKAATTKAALAAKRPGETVLLLRVREKDIRVYGGSRRAGPVLFDDLGLTPHDMVPLDKEHQEISLENLPQLTADHIFLMVEDKDRMTSIEATELWQRLPAVQAGHVYPVSMEPWNQSVGPISFAVVIDDVAAALL
ncbi:iron-siderophore ABC transporter substrate-binding protein [Devosia sp. 2618]|uniref:iron-siderophore ABC transporter substrate-binding protein n=1 Tax=Devosia sp. 2618 TaxID=3156454 RepID=UPI003399AE70